MGDNFLTPSKTMIFGRSERPRTRGVFFCPRKVFTKIAGVPILGILYDPYIDIYTYIYIVYIYMYIDIYIYV